MNWWGFYVGNLSSVLLYHCPQYFMITSEQAQTAGGTAWQEGENLRKAAFFGALPDGLGVGVEHTPWQHQSIRRCGMARGNEPAEGRVSWLSG